MSSAYYKNGILYDVSPRNTALSLYDDRETAYRATTMVLDGIEYSLETIEGVNSIPVIRTTPTWDSTLSISYILKMHLSCVSNPDIIPCFVDKVLNLMRLSGLLWRRRDYLQVIRNYYRMGLFYDGDMFEQHYRSLYPELFSKPEDDSHEAEHLRTKMYFKRKWDKKHSLSKKDDE